ncbi:SulP family inorganic anion transporter [Curvibacter gracilis]|uniref:SulP family inorganic anion transporter n=1 Tax=Curvibacter gracilis TaxID=230310 RepID=UPI0004B5ABED|nr:SulP family inorganic anion transporter [Curvibacter gracilis]
MTEATLATPTHAAVNLGSFWRQRPSWLNLRADFLAGLTVAAISLPQSIAYALIAGVDPTFGLYAAIVFTAVAGLLGSSNHLVNGPTGAVSLVVFSALAFIDPSATYELYEALFFLAVLIGVVQILIAALRLGNLTRYISESVVTGFIVGAAVLTIIGQVASALGVKSQGTGHQHVLYRLWLTLSQEAPINPKAVAISLGAIVLAIVSRRLVKRYQLPQLDMLLVLLLVSGAAWAFGWSAHGPGIKPAVSLIESVPARLPGFHIPEIRWHWFIDLSGSAVAIAVLGLLEALAIAKAIAHKSGQELDYNRQIMAEGIGNLVGGFFRAMPGAGSLSRTAINYQAGAVSRFAGVFAALVVAVVVVALGPLTAYIPKAALAGLLIVAASRLIDVDRLRYVIKGSRYDALLLLATALAGVFVNIEFAILIGVLVSVAGYVPRASRLRSRELIVSPERVVRERLSQDDEPGSDVLIIDIEGELFFGAAPELEEVLYQAARTARARGTQHLVLRLKRARNPDIVAIEVLEHFLKDARAQGLTVLLAGVGPELHRLLKRIGADRYVPEELVFPEEDEEFSASLKAIRKARSLQPTSATRNTAEGAYYLV